MRKYVGVAMRLHFQILVWVTCVCISAWKSSFRTPPILSKPVQIVGREIVEPGDYVTHEKYGVGVYKGVTRIQAKLADPRTIDFLVVQFQDADLILSWMQAQTQLFINRHPEKDESELMQRQNSYTIGDTKKWDKRRKDSLNSKKRELVFLMDLYRERAEKYRTPSIETNEEYRKFEAAFPYDPTVDQIQCFNDIARDMVNFTIPMNRLVCGDVGFGKTEVSFRALYRAVLSGKQVAFMSPTRLLAMQHYKSMVERFPQLNIACMHASLPYSEIQRIKKGIISGEVQVVVGTQIVLRDDLAYKNLGMLIVDEEQRFGVETKMKLVKKYSTIDILTLTATPIPRTLQQAMDGLIDISTLDTPPVQRKPIQIEIIQPSKMGLPLLSPLTEANGSKSRKKKKLHVDFDAMAKRAAEEQSRNDKTGQSFVICPHIDNLQLYEQELLKRIPSLKIVQIHGKMIDIENRVERFSNGEFDVLLATSVIENGINIPTVNAIFVCEAESFGLATLYQLKGRVGRGLLQGRAYFLLGTSLQNSKGDVETRLSAIQTFHELGSGRSIAQADLSLRGAGSMYSTNQSGVIDWIGPGLANRYAELLSRTLTSRSILPVRDTLTLLDDTLEQFARRVDPTLTLPNSTSDVRSIAIFEMAIIRNVLDFIADKHNLMQTERLNLENALLKKLSGGDKADDVIHSMLQTVFNKDVPMVINKLLQRIQLRALCRRGGINFVFNSNVHDNQDYSVTPYFRIGMDKMNSQKWKLVQKYAPKNNDILNHLNISVDEAMEKAEIYTKDLSLESLHDIVQAIDHAASSMFRKLNVDIQI